MRNVLLTTQFLGMFLLTGLLFGQTSKKVEEKINNLNGEVKKITITTEKGETTFYNSEAEELLKIIKKGNEKKLVKVITASGDSENIQLIVNKLNDDNSNVKTLTIDDGGKITIITKQNDKKKVKVYTGEEAKEFLKKNKDLINIEEMTKDGKKVKTVILKSSEIK